MLDHYEECLDSTFIPACSIRNTDATDISVFFVPQSFGRVGGTGMWNGSFTALSYGDYEYRVPAPQEFRMTCNSALIRGAKAVLPYSLCSYIGNGAAQNKTDAGFLDENNIPFDAPFEEWAYMDRPQDSINYIPPDLIPPFIDGYDPLYDLPDRPQENNDQRDRENFLLWKFAAYSRLWNSARTTFGEIARVAPELALLNWWNGLEDDAAVSSTLSPLPVLFPSPQIKVFTDSTESACYLFYFNRYCRANDIPLLITVDSDDFFGEGVPFSEYALDHNRRCIIEGTESSGVYTFRDTLDAGEARLIQMFDDSRIPPLPCDIRITDPDVFVVMPYDSDTLSDYASPPGEAINVHARFYNMGTESLSNLKVYLQDETDHSMLDTARVSFTGLSTNRCYEQDMDEVIFTWNPDSTDIGIHRLRVFTDGIPSEPDTADNDARLVYIVEPRDYAATVLSDPWDMTEADSISHPWCTDDIVDIGGEWISAGFTDSISGMFEGKLSTAISGSILRGDVSLNINANLPVNTDLYSNLSFAAVCLNPNPNATSTSGAIIHLWWKDSRGTTYTANISNESEIGTLWNANTLWKEYGPLDLSSVSGLNWGSDEAVELWLSFRAGKPAAPSVPQPVDIRLGWVKLTE